VKKVKKIIEVDAFDFGDGRVIEAKMINQFLHMANEEFIETIDCADNYTSNYFYFESDKEKELAKVLLDKKVIRLSPHHDYNNDRVGKIKHHNTYFYWLDKGFEKFEDEFYNILYKED
jgi:hypothetical protein